MTTEIRLMAAGIALCCGAWTVTASAQVVDAVTMTSSQIDDHNATLDRSDPQFIRCVRDGRTGSLLKRKVCRTNTDWDRRAEAGNREARDIVNSIQLHGSTHGEEPAGSIQPILTPG